ncbi:hypothetical protein H5410_061236 [Solanum commersonii]|uniref:ACT domain-containing protein ACR n=1 Tax=Solanum commersonii TaxID=4109 RepID=A0A9J5W909_SOLCO|nr:hypothetical protein H5410_061236 [Solanum commersonii]
MITNNPIWINHTRKIYTITNDHARINSPSDRPGLLSEVSTILTNLKCNVVTAKVWTHNAPTSAVVKVTGEETGGTINDPKRLSMMNQLLYNVLRYSNKLRNSETIVSEQDYERAAGDELDEKERPNVSVLNWYDKDYFVVRI